MNEYKEDYPYPKFWKFAEQHYLYSKMPDYTMFVGIFLDYFNKHGYKCGIELTTMPEELHKLFVECEKL